MPMYEDEKVEFPVRQRFQSDRYRVALSNIEPQYRYEWELKGAVQYYPEFAEEVAEGCARGLSLCESPIEQCLFPWLVAQRYGRFRQAPAVLLPDELEAGATNAVSVTPQFVIGRFRADFALSIRLSDGLLRIVVVECDGRDFHSSPEQVARDKGRDEILMADPRVMGIVRICGKNIHLDAMGAADYVANSRAWGWPRRRRTEAEILALIGEQ